MLNQKRDHVPRSESAKKTLAMAYAQAVELEFQLLEVGYTSELHKFVGKALTSYRKFLKDAIGYKVLLSQYVISGLREQPELKTTSRLVLYFLTNAQTEVERNTAAKYAHIVDYLHMERIDNASAADYLQTAGGIEAILKKAREALKAADETGHDEDREFDQWQEPDETGAPASAHSREDLFDLEMDLSIRVGRKTLKRVLDPEIDIEASFYVECKKTGPVGRHGVRIVGRLVDLAWSQRDVQCRPPPTRVTSCSTLAGPDKRGARAGRRRPPSYGGP
jgi:hypothetical protein